MDFKNRAQKCHINLVGGVKYDCHLKYTGILTLWYSERFSIKDGFHGKPNQGKTLTTIPEDSF